MAALSGLTVRPATDADWDGIWPFWAATVEAGDTYAYPWPVPPEQAKDLWYDGTVLVAVDDDGTVLGSAKCGPNRPGRGAHVGTASFMVSPAARGRGVGRLLGEHVLALLAAQGFRAVQFNAVVETNTSAVRLWESLGFTVVGTVPEAFDSATHGLVGLHVMHRRLP